MSCDQLGSQGSPLCLWQMTCQKNMQIDRIQCLLRIMWKINVLRIKCNMCLRIWYSITNNQGTLTTKPPCSMVLYSQGIQRPASPCIYCNLLLRRRCVVTTRDCPKHQNERIGERFHLMICCFCKNKILGKKFLCASSWMHF